MARGSRRRISPTSGTLGEIVEREQLGAQAVVDVVGVIGDVVGDGRDLRLGAGVAPELEILGLAVTRGSPRGTPRSR